MGMMLFCGQWVERYRGGEIGLAGASAGQLNLNVLRVQH